MTDALTIATVTMNPALDHMSKRPISSPGGKGIMVASVLAHFGPPMAVAGLLARMCRSKRYRPNLRAHGLNYPLRYWIDSASPSLGAGRWERRSRSTQMRLGTLGSRVKQLSE